MKVGDQRNNARWFCQPIFEIDSTSGLEDFVVVGGILKAVAGGLDLVDEASSKVQSMPHRRKYHVLIGSLHRGTEI